MYDFGPKKNYQKYGKPFPLRYPLENITAPVSFHYADNDFIVHTKVTIKNYQLTILLNQNLGPNEANSKNTKRSRRIPRPAQKIQPHWFHVGPRNRAHSLQTDHRINAIIQTTLESGKLFKLDLILLCQCCQNVIYEFCASSAVG